MSQENVEIVRRAFAEFGLSPTGVEEAARAGLVATDAVFDFSAVYPDGPTVRGLESLTQHADSLPWGRSPKGRAARFRSRAERTRVHDPGRGRRARQGLLGPRRGPRSL